MKENRARAIVFAVGLTLVGIGTWILSPPWCLIVVGAVIIADASRRPWS